MYDVAIIGLGTAGYTAAIYCARYGLKVFLVGFSEGGTGMVAAEVGDWPGDIHTTGPELMERQKKHVQSFESVTYRVKEVKEVIKKGASFELVLSGGENVEAKSVIFAMGGKSRKIGVPGEERLSGKGVTYCATCDAFFFRGKTVAVVGGGDSALEGTVITAQVAKKVYLIHRRNEFRGQPYWQKRVNEASNIELVLERNVTEILGDQKVTGLRLDKEHNGSTEIALDGVFVEIGHDPLIEIPKKLGCVIDDRGYLLVDEAMRTNVPGALGAGDISSGSNHFAQFVTAAGEGSIAAKSAFEYLQETKE